MSLNFKIGLVAAVALLFFSCSTNMGNLQMEKLPKVKDQRLVEVVDSLASTKFNYFYSKISTKYQDSSRNVSFKTSVRITSDSAINTLITFAKFPVLNALLTKDSVFITDKRDKCFVKEGFEYIKNNYAIDFSFKNVEELILGLPIDYDINDRHYVVNDPYSYTLSSHRKRDRKKNDKGKEREIITYYTLTDDLRSLKTMRIESPEDSAVVQVDYLTRELVDNLSVPVDVTLYISTPQKNINVGLEYRKSRVNEPEPIYFVIPESYEVCE